MRVLFVCDGNTCRSPLAEAAARALGVDASSAGLFADPGAPATVAAAAAGAERGLDLSDHRSRLVTAEAVEAASVIYTMTDAQAKTIRARWPEVAGKVARLDQDGDIADPFGRSESVYRRTLRQIEQAIAARLPA